MLSDPQHLEKGDLKECKGMRINWEEFSSNFAKCKQSPSQLVSPHKVCRRFGGGPCIFFRGHNPFQLLAPIVSVMENEAKTQSKTHFILYLHEIFIFKQ